VSGKDGKRGLGLAIPYPRSAIIGRRENARAVWIEPTAPHSSRMTDKNSQSGPGFGVPQPASVVVGCGNDKIAVRAPGHVFRMVGVPFENG
jgi:hypothetical protein